jgi:hypothetical protein
MKSRSLAFLKILSVLLLIASCATKPELLEKAPEWAFILPADTGTARIFRGEGEGDSPSAARNQAIENLGDAVISAMNLGDPKLWNSEGSSAVKKLLDELGRIVRGMDGASIDGVEVLRQDAWRNSRGTITYMVDISWENQAFKAKTAELLQLLYRLSPEFMELEKQAGIAENGGNLYEAALLWAAAAGVAQRDGNVPALEAALGEIERILKGVEIVLKGVPAEAFAGLRPSSPVLFAVSAPDKPLANAEAVIWYPRKARDGSLLESGAEARIISDNNGIVRFLPPEVPFAGTQTVTIAISADPFLEYLEDVSGRLIEDFVKNIETPRASGEYQALSRTRTIPTGIIILQTDLAGNPLAGGEAARGVLDDLTGDGFTVALINLNAGQYAARLELEFLRDLKADSAVAGKFERIIHGTVKLDSFEQDGENFNVKVSGTLVLSDIQRQVSIYRSEITKASRATGSEQAISSAFRQLGRSFAGELIQELP